MPAPCSRSASTSEDPPLRLTRHTRYSVSGTSVGVTRDPTMPNDEVLARLDALFLDVKQRREEELRKRYSYLDSPHKDPFRDRRGAGERKTSGPTGERRTSGTGPAGRKGNPGGERRWSATADRLSNGRQGTPNGPARSFSIGGSLDRRRSASSSSAPLRGYANSVPRGGGGGQQPSAEPRRSSSSSSSRNDKRFSLNGLHAGKRASLSSDSLSGGYLRGGASKERSPPDGVRRGPAAAHREASGKGAYRRDSLDVERLTGTRRHSYYDSSILEEDESGGPGGGARRRPISVHFSPPPNNLSSPRQSPSRSSPSRSSPSRSTPPRPLSFGRIRRPSDLEPGPLDRLFQAPEEEGPPCPDRRHSDAGASRYNKVSSRGQARNLWVFYTEVALIIAI